MLQKPGMMLEGLQASSEFPFFLHAGILKRCSRSRLQSSTAQRAAGSSHGPTSGPQEPTADERPSPKHPTVSPGESCSDKATQFPEPVDGSSSKRTHQGPSWAPVQSLALALALQHGQGAALQASSISCAEARAEIDRVQQTASFEKAARLRAQRELASLRASRDAMQAELHQERAKLSAQEASARQAAAAVLELLPADKATQFPEPSDGSSICTQKLPPATSMQSLALALVLRQQQAAKLQAASDACAEAQADAASMRQEASFQKRARIRAQQEASALQASRDTLQTALQKATADVAAQEAFARQANAAAKESAQLSCKNEYELEAASKKCSELVNELSETKRSYRTSEVDLQAANEQCTDLRAQLHVRQEELARQADWQVGLKLQLKIARSSVQRLERQAAAAADENKKQLWRLQEQLQAASQTLEQHQRASQQLQQDDETLKGHLSSCQAALVAERRAAEGSNQEAKQLRLQMQQLLSQQQVATQKLQKELVAFKEDASRYRSEREQARNDLAKLAEAKAAADQTIAAHWRAGAAKDAAIKDTTVKLASAMAQVRLQALRIPFRNA